MYSKWKIPEDICTSRPIGPYELKNFVGHKNLVNEAINLLNSKRVIMLEGAIGVGKTSTANYIRFKKENHLTPLVEISCQANWSNEEFIHNILVSVADHIFHNKDQETYKKILKNNLLKKLKDRYEDKTTYGGGASIAGCGGSASETVERSTIPNNQAVIKKDMINLGLLIHKEFKTSNSPIIIQLNNLDLGDSFSESELKIFLNSIRDTLQIDNYSWILNGKTGLLRFVEKNVKQLSQIATGYTLPLLSINEIQEVFTKRIKNSGLKGELPISKELLELLYDSCEGSFREVIKIIDELLRYFVARPFVECISIENASDLYKQKMKQDLDTLMSRKNIAMVIKVLQDNQGAIQAELKVIDKNLEQINLSRMIKTLEEKRVIHRIFDDIDERENIYFTPKYRLVMLKK